MKRGMALLELTIACFVMGLLFVILFHVYRVGASAWKKTEAQTELVQNFQVAKARLTREVERSTLASLTVDPQGIAFLSALDDTGRFQVDPASIQPLWQKYVVVYHDPASRELRWREIPVTGTTTEITPGPIENFGATPQPLTSYFTGGAAFAREVDTCLFEQTPDDLVRFTWTGQKKRYGSEQPETLTLRGGVSLRNN